MVSIVTSLLLWGHYFYLTITMVTIFTSLLLWSLFLLHYYYGYCRYLTIIMVTILLHYYYGYYSYLTIIMVTILLHYYYGYYRYLTITLVTTVTSPFLYLLSSTSLLWLLLLHYRYKVTAVSLQLQRLIYFFHCYKGYCCYLALLRLLPLHNHHYVYCS